MRFITAFVVHILPGLPVITGSRGYLVRFIVAVVVLLTNRCSYSVQFITAVVVLLFSVYMTPFCLCTNSVLTLQGTGEFLNHEGSHQNAPATDSAAPAAPASLSE